MIDALPAESAVANTYAQVPMIDPAQAEQAVDFTYVEVAMIHAPQLDIDRQPGSTDPILEVLDNPPAPAAATVVDSLCSPDATPVIDGPRDESNDHKCDPREIQRLADKSRRQESQSHQHPQRQREHAARRRAAQFAKTARTRGRSYRKTAADLDVAPRTLRDWCALDPSPDSCKPRGRPCKQSSTAARHDVLELLNDTGPRIGLPALQRSFPDIPRCELTDLERDYRMLFRQEYSIYTHLLTWHTPRRVWAMDHSDPPTPVDGLYPAIFAVRDLASGMQLAWLPVRDMTDGTTGAVLQALFRQYGPPLVLKSDNGSAFISRLIRELLASWRVTPLFSPPVTPEYNGACEAGIGAMKTRTHEQAAHRGSPGLWTSEHLEAARRHANEFHIPNANSTAQEFWNLSPEILIQERHRFLQTVQRLRSELIDTLASPGITNNTQHLSPACERHVIRQALVELGMLSTQWRSIPLPIKRRKMAKIT